MDAISAARRPKYARLDGYQDVTGASPSQLSNLADAVLLHILSLLTTKEAVRTCLLSKRWIHLWTSLPELRFDDMQLVERAFLLRDPQCTLKTFALEHVSVTDDASCSVITKSINAAVRCKVQELSLRLSSHCESSFVLPGCVFGCQTLVKLELGFTRLKIPPSVQLPSLKVLRIWRVNFAEDAAAAEKLFSCPILEELQLVDCFLGCENITALEISAPKLRVLSISEEVGSSGYQVSINGTNLESFDYFGEFLNKFTIVGASEKLVRVKFSGYFRRNHMNPVAEHVHSLLASVSTTTNLILTYQCFEAITYNVNSSFRTYSLPTFGNLTHLAVDMLSIHLHRGLFVMLKKFPHLQTLELDQRHKDQAKLRQAEWEQYRSEDAPSCFSTHLKKIVVKEFCGARKEVNAVRVLLENAIVLEEMIIAFQEEFFTTFNTKRLTSLHRGSPKCRLSLVFGSVAEV